MNSDDEQYSNIYPLLMWACAALFYFYENLIQVSPNAMSNILMQSFGISATMLGTMQTIYYLTYSSMQIPVGILADKYGVRITLSIAAATCSLGVYWFASTTSINQALIARGLIGFGSAFAAISCLSIASSWFKDRTFSLLTGSLLSIGFTGSIVGVRWITWIIKQSETWQLALQYLAIIGLLIALAIAITVRNHPRAEPKESALTGLAETFKNLATWKIATYGALMFTPTLIFAAEWGVPYFVSCKSFTNVAAQNLITYMLIGFIIGAPAIGLFATQALRIRKILMCVAASTLTTSIIIINPHITNFNTLAALMFIFGFCSSGFLPAFTLIKLTSPANHRGAAFGIMNTMNMLGAAIAGPLIGFIIDLSQNNTPQAIGTSYNPSGYSHAFLIIPILLLLALTNSFFLPQIPQGGN